MKDIWRKVMKELWIYEEKKIWRSMKKNMWEYENKDSPYIWAVGLEKMSRSSYFGAGVAISRFRGTPEKKHETWNFEIILLFRGGEGGWFAISRYREKTWNMSIIKPENWDCRNFRHFRHVVEGGGGIWPRWSMGTPSTFNFSPSIQLRLLLSCPIVPVSLCHFLAISFYFFSLTGSCSRFLSLIRASYSL